MSSNLNLLLRPSHKSQIVRTNMKPNIHPFYPLAQKWQIQSSSYPPPKTPASAPPPLAQQQKDFEQQLKAHVANTTSSNIAADSLPLQKPAFIPWAVQIEKQQQKLDKYPASSNAKSPTINQPAEPNPTPTHNNCRSTQ